ncbi:hypothetical protein SS1G_04287 [Sclerotinia sclerotiorum 1980 UF-70]|uniref:RING-type domain-containing protein n=1 Tax=Sclerotinia sclerotiorum (strain ATCC 18683 / 1980 / Ss-1) TaxID=665079 RepID=A7EG46_SCLS1|nr:hypothetical protein SS1G_04287 [Sclerotinia sclerotiorum 1980 UF-70]EDO01812.1 hypothetical protein SS1G_04287 [Sclerotinia sclerotiorum 1980 UF-70]
MEPASSPTTARAWSNHGSRMRESTARSLEATPAATKVQTIMNVEDEESVQNDTQCLCQWFIPNKRKKTCPECRAPVKQIPAPAFLHKVNNAEVTEMVEKDKNSPEGLFGGSFPKSHGELWRDEADGVMRCPSCGHEHEGGPTCDICGAEFDDIYGFSDMDDDGDLSDIDVGYDEDVDLEIGAEFQMDADNITNFAAMRHNPRHYAFGGPAHQHILNHYHAHHLTMDDTEDDSEGMTNSDTSVQDNSEDEDAGSLEDFIAPEDDDSEPIRHQRRVNRVVTIISDEEGEEEDDEDDESEDEGGAITNRRRRRPGWTRSSENPSRSISISEDGNGSSTNGSEFGDDDAHETRMRLRASGGWSPLDEGDDEDNNGPRHDDYRGYATAEDERASDESDSETIGNPNSDAEDDDDRSRQGLSETPRYGNADFEQFPDDYASSIDGDATPIDYSRDRDDASNNYGSENENRYDYDTDGDHSTNMDRDGDTEMSVSPSVLSRSSRDVSVESNYGENLGIANEMAEVDDDLSDTSNDFSSRRQPRRNPVVQQYDPRISMLFAEHQNTVRNARNPEDMSPWGDDLNRNIRVEPASRSRRRGQNHYQAMSISNNGARNSHHRAMQPHGSDRQEQSLAEAVSNVER